MARLIIPTENVEDYEQKSGRTVNNVEDLEWANAPNRNIYIGGVPGRKIGLSMAELP